MVKDRRKEGKKKEKDRNSVAVCKKPQIMESCRVWLFLPSFNIFLLKCTRAEVITQLLGKEL